MYVIRLPAKPPGYDLGGHTIHGPAPPVPVKDRPSTSYTGAINNAFVSENTTRITDQVSHYINTYNRRVTAKYGGRHMRLDLFIDSKWFIIQLFLARL